MMIATWLRTSRALFFFERVDFTGNHIGIQNNHSNLMGKLPKTTNTQQIKRAIGANNGNISF